MRAGAGANLRTVDPELSTPPKKPKGKVLHAEMLDTPRIAKTLDDAIHEQGLDHTELGLASRPELVRVLKDSLDGLHQSLITIDGWMGEIWERLGARHPIVVKLRKALVGSNLDAARAKDATFVDGLGNVRPAAKPFRPENLHEVSDLRIKEPWHATGSKFCDRATLCINEAGEYLLVLTEEYKTAGVKAADRNAQQGKRNVRLNDSSLSSDAILTFVDAKGQKVEVFLAELRLHVENPVSQIGVQARTRSSAVDVRGTSPDPGVFEEVYVHQRVPWPGGRDLRRTLQTVLASLPKAKPR
jgi:hypothetical protein